MHHEYDEVVYFRSEKVYVNFADCQVGYDTVSMTELFKHQSELSFDTVCRVFLGKWRASDK